MSLNQIALLSVHTSPLDQPGVGDAGGLNVYVVETAKRLSEKGINVDIFTRRTSGAIANETEIFNGVKVKQITAGPFEGFLVVFHRSRHHFFKISKKRNDIVILFFS